MSAAYDSIASSNSSGSNTLTITFGTAVPDGYGMLALVAALDNDGAPALSPPAGWTQIATKSIGAATVTLWRRLASGEGTTYAFTKDGTAANAYLRGYIASISGAAVTGSFVDDYSNYGYTTNDANLVAGAVDTTMANNLLLFMAAVFPAGSDTMTPPPSMPTERLESSDTNILVYCATASRAGIGSSGSKTATISDLESVKHAFLVSVMSNVAPGEPVISAPAVGAVHGQSTTIDLTATATDPNGDQVLYRWKYDAGAGDQTIGDSALVNSGAAGTLAWDTSGLDAGAYTLKCWAVDSAGLVSATYDSVAITIVSVIITAPADLSSHISGTINLTGKGYLPAAGSLRLQWEIDTANPPDSANADYDFITSALVAQDTSVTVVGTVSHLDTWYARARTIDTSDVTNDWSSVVTFYVLEELKLLSGSQIEQSILSAANKVYVLAAKSSPAVVGTATNTTTAPTYASSPREVFVPAPEGSDQTAVDAIAAAQLAIRKDEKESYSGLKLPLSDGMKLQRGDQVGVNIERLGIDSTLPIRELVFDVANDECEVSVGQFGEAKTDQDMLLAIGQKVQSLAKEAAS